MKFHITQSSGLVLLVLMLMMGPQLYAYPLSATTEKSLNGGSPVADSIETAAELPALVFAENSGNSFLSRVFSAILQSEKQESLQTSEALPSPTVLPEKEEVVIREDEVSASPQEPERSNSALRFILFFGALGISWALIALLTFRLFSLRQQKSELSIETVTITSTGYQILGDIAAANNKFQLAEQCYRKIAEKESYNKEIHYEIGKALFQAERYQEAIREFQIALGCEIVSTDIYGFLAKAYQAINQSERAAQYSQKAMQFKNPMPAPRKKETRNVIPLQKRLKNPKAPRQAHKLSA